MSRPRAIQKYLRSLRTAARESDYAALVVGFEHRTCFVWSANLQAARQLESLLAVGGRPVALLGATVVGNAFVWRLDPLDKFREDEAVRAYLKAVGENVAEILEQRLASTLN